MEALQHFKVRKSVAHLHGEWCEAKQSEKNVPCVLSSCLDVWSLASVPMSPSSANICPDPSPAVSGLAIVMWPIGHNLCDPVFCSQATSIIWVWHRVFIISPIVTPPSYWPQICVYLFGSNLTPSIGSHCVYIPFLQVTKKNNSQPSTVRKFNRVWVILLLSVRDNTVAMLVSLADNPILFSASINTDYRCPIPRLGLTSSLQTDNLILHVHT